MAGLYENLMNSPQSSPLGYWEGLMQRGLSTPNPRIDDRRDENFSGAWNDDGGFAWQRVPQTLRALGVSIGNQIWGTPQIPEAPDSQLSDALGKRDMRIVPQVGSRSLLDRAIDDVSDGISIFLPPGQKLGSDVPFTQREFSPGIGAQKRSGS